MIVASLTAVVVVVTSLLRGDSWQAVAVACFLLAAHAYTRQPAQEEYADDSTALSPAIGFTTDAVPDPDYESRRIGF